MEFKDYYATLGWNRARARRRSRPPTAGWHASTTRTSARRPGPKTSSRRSTRRTRRCAIRKSVRPMTSCARRAIARARSSTCRRTTAAPVVSFRGSVRWRPNGGFSDFFESLFARQRGGAGAGAGPGFSSQGHAPNRDTRAKLSVPLEAAYSGDSLRITVNGKQLDARAQGHPPGPGDPLGRAGQPWRQSAAGGGIRRPPAVRGRWSQHPLYAAAHAVAGRAGHQHQRADPGWCGGTQDSGRFRCRPQLRLRGRGLPGNPDGDQIVEIEIVAPAATDEAQKKAYRNLAKAFGETI